MAAPGPPRDPALGPARWRAAPERAAAELSIRQLDDDDERLDDDPAAHLRLADAPVAERDRHRERGHDREARNVISIWKTYPPAWTPSNGIAASDAPATP